MTATTVAENGLLIRIPRFDAENREANLKVVRLLGEIEARYPEFHEARTYL